MESTDLKVLLIIERCNPDWSSVPLVGYRFYEQISQLVDATLITHERNKPALEKKHPNGDITYIFESGFIKRYNTLAMHFSQIRGRTIWPLFHALTYLSYAEFNHRAYRHSRGV